MPKLMKKIRAKKYFLRVFVVMLTVLIVLVSAIMWIVYLRMEQSLIEVEQDESQFFLEQLTGRIDYMDDTIRQQIVTIFFSDNTKLLLYSTSEDIYDQMVAVNGIKDAFVYANPSIHSIYIYNPYKEIYYSTYRSMYNLDEDFLDFYENESVSNLIPQMRIILDEQVITYQFSDSYYEDNDERKLYLNILAEWFFRNLGINMDEETGQGNRIMVYDDRLNLINDLSSFEPFDRELSQAIKKEMIAGYLDDTGFISFTLLHENENYIVNALRNEKLDWLVVKVQPEIQSLKEIRALRATMLKVNLAVLIFIFLIAIVITNNLYSPIRKILRDIVGSNRNMLDDEFTILKDYYTSSEQKINQMSKKMDINRNNVKEMVVRRMVTGAMTWDEMKTIMSELEIDTLSLNLESKMVLSVLRLSTVSKTEAVFDVVDDYHLLMFVIENILLENLSSYNVELLNMNRREFILIGNIDEDHRDVYIGYLKNVQKYIEQTYGIIITISIGEIIPDYRGISDEYKRVSDQLLYRFVYGRNNIFTSQNVSQNRKRIFIEYTFEEESTFISSLKDYKLIECKKELQRLITSLRMLEYESFLMAVQHLQSSIKDAIYDMNNYRRTPIDISDLHFDVNASKQMTLDDFSCVVLELIDTISENVNNSEEQNFIQGEQMIELIKSHYMDSELGAVMLGETLNISAAKAGKIFKQYTGESIPGYINNYRLSQAVKWMRNSNQSLSEIAVKVGYLSDSYFFRVFKKKYGETPRSYMDQLRIEKKYK